MHVLSSEVQSTQMRSMGRGAGLDPCLSVQKDLVMAGFEGFRIPITVFLGGGGTGTKSGGLRNGVILGAF